MEDNEEGRETTRYIPDEVFKKNIKDKMAAKDYQQQNIGNIRHGEHQLWSKKEEMELDRAHPEERRKWGL